MPPAHTRSADGEVQEDPTPGRRVGPPLVQGVEDVSPREISRQDRDETLVGLARLGAMIIAGRDRAELQTALPGALRGHPCVLGRTGVGEEALVDG